MVFYWIDKTKQINSFYHNEFGHYDVPYPTENKVSFPNKSIEVTLSNYTYDGLTLSRVSELESRYVGQLVWTHPDNEVQNVQTQKPN